MARISRFLVALVCISALSAVFILPARACVIPGHYWDDDVLGQLAINEDLTGSYWPFTVCGFPFDLTASPTWNGFTVSAPWNGYPDCMGFTATVTFDAECNDADGTFVNDHNQTGTVHWHRTPTVVFIQNQIGSPYIGASDVVVNGISGGLATLKIRTTADLWISAYFDFGSLPARDLDVHLVSSNATDEVTQPLLHTDYGGHTTARVATLNNRSTTSRITTDTVGVDEVSYDDLTWLPARYDKPFTTTCYDTSLESNHHSGALIPAPGIDGPDVFHADFLDDVHDQGSGQALSGKFLQYYKGIYFYTGHNGADCPKAGGQCVSDGLTAAVDAQIVPKWAQLYMPDDNTGWLAQDTGGGVHLHHIDRYYGFREADCLAYGTHPHNVTLQGY